MVATSGGPTMLARIGVMRALNRHGHRVLEPSGKKHHWGRRKLARATDDTRYLRDLPTVVPARESPRLTGPGIPIRVVVPSVSVA
jgi:hypothetical protein